MMHPLTVIEMAIGLSDDTDVPASKLPALLARYILDELHLAGWVMERDCRICVECGHVGNLP